jgi:hypothetical protein
MACFDGARYSVTGLMRGRKYTKKHRMERSKNLELHLTEAELETLVNAVRNTSDGRFAELEFKLRAAWRRALSQSDYRSAILTLVESVQVDNFFKVPEGIARPTRPATPWQTRSCSAASDA